MKRSQPEPQGVTDDAPSMRVRQLAALLASLLLGIGLGLFLLSRVFLLIPTDLQRLGVLVGALRDDPHPPSVVVLGNSVIMSGVDARQLSNDLPDHPVAWNCASTGQTLIEAFLLTQELPAATRRVIYSIPVRAGSKEETLHPDKYNTLFMFGFRPNAETIATVDRIYGPPLTDLLTRSALAEVFASRWALRQFVDTQARRFLRNDLQLGRATHDLFHPQSYERPIDPAVTARFIEGRRENLDQNPPAVSSDSGDLARAILREHAERGRKIIFLFPPVHPDLLSHHGPAIRSATSAFERSLDDFPDVLFIDAIGLLGTQDYIDDMHPTNEGARLLTRYIAERIARP